MIEYRFVYSNELNVWKRLLASPYKNHSHGADCWLAIWQLLLANQNRHLSEQGIHLNIHSKKTTTHQLLVIKLLVSRLYLKFEKRLSRDHTKQKLQEKWLGSQLYHWRHCFCWLNSSMSIYTYFTLSANVAEWPRKENQGIAKNTTFVKAKKDFWIK